MELKPMSDKQVEAAVKRIKKETVISADLKKNGIHIFDRFVAIVSYNRRTKQYEYIETAGLSVPTPRMVTKEQALILKREINKLNKYL
jgi:hypothetical protein